MPNNKPIIILTGGGTLGSVVPMLALADDLKKNYQPVWLGSKKGIEAKIVADEGLPYMGISGGKWRRYFSIYNFFDLFLIIAGFWQSLSLIRKLKPKIIITAGSFISVPVVFAGYMCRVPILVQQLDYVPGLANKIMSRVARHVLVVFNKSVQDYAGRGLWTGAPVRRELLSRPAGLAEAKAYFKLHDQLPVILIMGGGTGSQAINQLIISNLHNLSQVCQIIHLVGTGKSQAMEAIANYHQFELLSQPEVAVAYSVSDIVVSRAGMGALAELAYLQKPAIIIPMPDSHQEANAKVLAESRAAVVLPQKNLTALELYRQIKAMLADKKLQQELGRNLAKTLKVEANDEILKIVEEIIK